MNVLENKKLKRQGIRAPWRLFYVLMLVFVAILNELDSDVDETNNISISIPTRLYSGC